ncbi:hypothetical protein RFI_30539 [Reticulomyxa filosa]|uniref:Uncharacterized protein n=1 Tax=Reticulomyxa filosa TaxID=46433 RepID=X6LY64_RETFI|nr:hypothetical protein RFI_30539 [Reticulomyxa filosa]|eukprot:ETO06853.1 hypothetical protein RFI_30539 [Reticulomyxa filosa]
MEGKLKNFALINQQYINAISKDLQEAIIYNYFYLLKNIFPRNQFFKKNIYIEELKINETMSYSVGKRKYKIKKINDNKFIQFNIKANKTIAVRKIEKKNNIKKEKEITDCIICKNDKRTNIL